MIFRKSAKIWNQIESNPKDIDTVIVPLIQFGALGIRQDEKTTLQLFSDVSSKNNVIHLATGYFNLTQKFINTILKSNAVFNILTSSPKVFLKFFFNFISFQLKS